MNSSVSGRSGIGRGWITSGRGITIAGSGGS